MPPNKGKKTSVDCVNCGCTILNGKDVERHLRYCSTLEPFAWESDRNMAVRDVHVLVDKMNHIAMLKIDRDAECPTYSAKLNPETMGRAGFVYGEVCVIVCPGTLQVVTCIPNENISLDTVIVSKHLVAVFPLAIIAKCRGHSVHAISCANLTSINAKSFSQNPEFAQFVLNELTDKYLHADGMINVNYYGQRCNLSMSTVKSVPVAVQDDYVHVEDQLSPAMLDLSLNGQSSASDSIVSSCSSPSANASSLCSPNLEKGGEVNIPGLPEILLSQTVFQFTSNSIIRIDEAEKMERDSVDWAKIGGASAVKEALNRFVYCTDSERSVVRSILLHGPSGCGKSLVGLTMSECTRPKCHYLTATSIFSKSFSNAELELKNVVEKISVNERAILFVDDLDMVGGSAEDSSYDRKPTLLLCSILDRLPANICVVSCIRKADLLDASLRRRFQMEVLMSVPSPDDRLSIIHCVMASENLTMDESSTKYMAQQAHGYTGSDLLSAVRLVSSGLAVSLALRKIRPSAMREITLEIPTAKWEEIGGLADVKMKIKQAVEWPLKHPDAFKRLGVRPPSGILLYGPPGCSKTLLARTAASESNLNLLAIKGPEIFSKYVGESERSIRELFSRARQVAPALIFIDEIDALAVSRGSDKSSGVGDRVLAQLLTEMDGLEPLASVVLIAATNRPDIIDPALLRPGRLDRSVYVPLPDAATRREIMHLRLANMPTEPLDCDKMQQLTDCTDGYSGAEVVAVCEEAALSAMRNDIHSDVVAWSDLLNALDSITPKTHSDLLNLYSNFQTSSK